MCTRMSGDGLADAHGDASTHGSGTECTRTSRSGDRPADGYGDVLSPADGCEDGNNRLADVSTRGSVCTRDGLTDGHGDASTHGTVCTRTSRSGDRPADGCEDGNRLADVSTRGSVCTRRSGDGLADGHGVYTRTSRSGDRPADGYGDVLRPADGCEDGNRLADVSMRGSGGVCTRWSWDELADGIPATRHLKTATFAKLKDVTSSFP